jgi:hypothetical protein
LSIDLIISKPIIAAITVQRFGVTRRRRVVESSFAERAALEGSGGGVAVAEPGGAPHEGHAVARELICLPHSEHEIRAIGEIV